MSRSAMGDIGEGGGPASLRRSGKTAPGGRRRLSLTARPVARVHRPTSLPVVQEHERGRFRLGLCKRSLSGDGVITK